MMVKNDRYNYLISRYICIAEFLGQKTKEDVSKKADETFDMIDR